MSTKSSLNVIGDKFLIKICAWCKRSMGESFPEIPGTTHGICEICYEAVRQELLDESGIELSAHPASHARDLATPIIPLDGICLVKHTHARA